MNLQQTRYIHMKPIACLLASLLFFQFCKESEIEDPPYTDFSIYLTTDTLARKGIILDEVVIDKPLVEYDDILAYDSANHILYLSISTDTIFHYTKKYDGRGFVAVLNKKVKVYCGAIWSPTHSSTNPNIVITLPLDNLNNNYRLQVLDNYHDPALHAGYAQINDKRVIDLFKRDNKLR